MDKRNSLVLHVVKNIFNVYEEELVGKLLPPSLQHNNFLLHYTIHKNQSVKLNLKVYDELRGDFRDYNYSSIDKSKVEPNLWLLQRNI